VHTITLVTGNPGKLNEWQRLFPADYKLAAADVDLDEIQSLDLEAIAADKVKRAYKQLGKPVLVEDVSAGLDNLGGMPGPFIKYFEKRLGLDALFKLAEKEGDPATVICTVAYYDGKNLITAQGQVNGSVCAPRGENGFGFDKVFVPGDGARSFAELSPQEKDAVSHRSLAVNALVEQLEQMFRNTTSEESVMTTH